MSRRFYTTLCAVVTAITAAFANDLDDKFGLICAIDGVDVVDFPDEDCRKNKMKSGKIAILQTPEQLKSAKAITGNIDSELNLIDIHEDDIDINGWLISENDDEVTLLMFVSNSDINTVTLCKGPKSMIDTMEIDTD